MASSLAADAKADDGLPQPRRFYAIGAASFGTALVVLDGQIANVALPTIARDLGVPGSSAVLIVTVYQLVLVMTLLPFSALGDRLGHRTLYQYGQMLFTVATVLCFFATSLPFLLVVRAVQALGAAAALSVSSALIRSIYPARQLGRGIGINGVIVACSAALAPTLGGLILAIAPWQWVFAASVPLALLSIWLGRSLPDPEPRAEPFDRMGALLSAVTFGLIFIGLESGVHGGGAVPSAIAVAAGFAIGTVFVRRELKEPRPILPVDLLARPVFALSTLSAFCAFTGSMTLFVSLPFRLQQGFHFTPGEVGAMIAPWPFVAIFIGPAAAVLSDRVPAGLLGGVGMSVAACAYLLLAFLPADASHLDIAWRMGMCGAGYGLFLSPNARLQVGSAPKERAASAGGMISTTRLTGQTLGATIAAGLLAFGLGTGSTPAFVGAALTIAAAISSLARLNPALRKPLQGELTNVE